MIGRGCTIAAAVFIFVATSTFLRAEEPILHMELAVSFNLDQELLIGTAKVTVPRGVPLNLDIGHLDITGITLSDQKHENRLLSLSGKSRFILEADEKVRTIHISYTRKVKMNFRDMVSREAIILTSAWHPIPADKALFKLNATVPPGFTAISESDHFEPTNQNGKAFFAFSQPLSSLTFAAAPYVIQSRKVRDKLEVHTLFFEQEAHLAREYLDAAAGYILRYEKEIGPFPYNHYLIVENPMPTGFGMPTFTLLGRQVLRLPFIKDTSLGHEILHSWFGNSIEPDYQSGNWSEGLTTYLADMAYRTDKGEGAESRREKIQEFESYVSGTTPPLGQFAAAGHGGRDNRGLRAVGYGRSAMLFHELKLRVGEESFYQSLQDFYRQYKNKTASWLQIQQAFENRSGQDLAVFFRERLERNDLPELVIEEIATADGPEGTTLSFSVRQKGSPYELVLPVTIRTLETEISFLQPLKGKKTVISRAMMSQPLELVIDSEYDLMRRPSKEERYPSWSRFLADSDVTLVLSSEEVKNVYEPFLEMGALRSWNTISAKEFETADLSGRSVIFLGESPGIKRLFGPSAHQDSGLTIETRFHPLHEETVVALITSSSLDETAAAFSRLEHYGRYSFLHFKDGKIQEQSIAQSARGMRFELTPEPTGFAMAQLSDFDRLIDELSRHRVVYLGESHTSRSDHVLQKMIIEALYRKDSNLAIGMEMFPRSSGKTLNDYTLDRRIDEHTFIKQSRYFDVWNFDYRLFRPIFAFAREHRIPVLGLNIEREVVSAAYKEGGINRLDEAQRKEVPATLDLSMEGYADRLRSIHAMHSAMDDAKGDPSAFIEAQAIWDEFMAESISNYLQAHPQMKMVVIAGSQHTRKDSGIPPRVARFKSISQASVLNLATNRITGEELEKTTDYLFSLDVSDFKPQGKIGVILEPASDPVIQGMMVASLLSTSNALKAGLAEQDIITGIDDIPIREMDDIRIAMLDKLPGETVTITISRRSGNTAPETKSIKVELYSPPPQTPHP